MKYYRPILQRSNEALALRLALKLNEALDSKSLKKSSGSLSWKKCPYEYYTEPNGGITIEQDDKELFRFLSRYAIDIDLFEKIFRKDIQNLFLVVTNVCIINKRIKYVQTLESSFAFETSDELMLKIFELDYKNNEFNEIETIVPKDKKTKIDKNYIENFIKKHK